MLRRSLRQFVPKRNWQNLSALATGQKNAEAWNELKARDAKVESTIHANSGATPKAINWAEFEKTTSHPEIVASLKNYYNEQMEILSKLEKEDSTAKVAELSKGWNLHKKAVNSLEKSVEESEKIVQSGVKALWISANNPDITRVKTNEWLDTDLYFQAVVDRVASLSPSGYQFTKQEAKSDKDVMDTLKLIDDRSDVKRRNTWMNQLHSFEYYDLHRRALLEHMTYYLLRTGGDVRFFPEIPPMDWLAHIEQIRRNFAGEAHARRAAEQLEKLEKEMPLDLNPVEYSHGEDHFAHLLDAEATFTDLLTGRLMGFYGFLSAPYVPIRTEAELAFVLQQDNGNGEFFSFGKDVHAVFYLPASKSILRPATATHNLVNYLKKDTEGVVPGYLNIMESVATVLEKRGEHWLNVPGESVAQAFLRRLKADDPARAVYVEYVAELEKKMKGAEKISKDVAVETLKKMAATIQAEDSTFVGAIPAFVSSELSALKDKLASAEALHASGSLAKVLSESKTEHIKHPEAFIQSLKEKIAFADEAKDALQL